MKHIKKYNESTDDMYLLIDDYFLEYSEKWKLKEESEYFNLPRYGFEQKSDYNGVYQIEQVSTRYFKKEYFKMIKMDI